MTIEAMGTYFFGWVDIGLAVPVHVINQGQTKNPIELEDSKSTAMPLRHLVTFVCHPKSNYQAARTRQASDLQSIPLLSCPPVTPKALF